MRLKKYRVASLPEAMKLIKRDLGPEAVILHSHDIKPTGPLGFIRKPMIEVVAAADEDRKQAPGARAAAQSARTAPKANGTPAPPAAEAPSAAQQTMPRRAAQPEPTHPEGKQPSPEPAATPAVPPSSRPRALVARSYAAAGNGVSVEISSSPQPETAPAHPEKPVSSLTAPVDPILRELAELRETVGKLVATSQVAGLTEASPMLARCYSVLIEQETGQEMSAEVVLAVRRELSDRALIDPAIVREAVARSLTRRFFTRGPLQPRVEGPRVVFLIGPTGVGKTTTLAKLAANLAIERYQVTLVTADTFRVAAIPQLQTYAEILGVPLEVVYTPAELAEVVAAHHERGFVLVDTPGRSQYRDAQIDKLSEFVIAAPHRTVYLTVSANTRGSDLRQIAQRFGKIPFDGVLFTKLDETCRFGGIVNLAASLGKPLTYFTTGQNVPTDIEIADAGKLATMILESVDG